MTTVLGVINKPALIGWAAKEERKATMLAAAEYYRELAETLGEPLEVGEFFRGIDSRLDGTKAHQRALNEASTIGTMVHKKIEFDLLRKLLPMKMELTKTQAEFKKLQKKYEGLKDVELTHPKAEESWRKYLLWRDSVRMEPLESERQVVSHVHKYAGTEDLLLRVWPEAEDPLWGVVPGGYKPGGSLIVTGDFKTGKSVYGEMFLQNGAYRLAEIEMGFAPQSEAGLIIRLPKNVEDPGFEVVAVPPLSETIPAFLAARALYNWYRAEDEAYQAKRAQWRAIAEEHENDG